MRESNTSKTREFILANKDKYNNIEMVNILLETTNFKKNSIDAIINTTLKKCGYYTEKSKEIKEYIRKHIKTTSKQDLTRYIMNNSMIGRNISFKLIEEVEIEEATKISKTERKIKDLYKGRERSFFRIDDSSLYRGLI